MSGWVAPCLSFLTCSTEPALDPEASQQESDELLSSCLRRSRVTALGAPEGPRKTRQNYGALVAQMPHRNRTWSISPAPVRGRSQHRTDKGQKAERAQVSVGGQVNEMRCIPAMGTARP